MCQQNQRRSLPVAPFDRLKIYFATAFCTFLAFGGPGYAQGLLAGIVTPDEHAPLVLEPGGVAEITAKLRLPLTPPPGVQQRRAKRDWQVSFSRTVLHTLGETDGLLQMPGEVLRIRPTRNGLYRFSVALPPWMPPGCYDIHLAGPGVMAQRHRAVSVGHPHCGAQLSDVSVIHRTDDELVLRHTATQRGHWRFELIASADTPAVRVIAGDRSLKPAAAGWAQPPDATNNRRRYLIYLVPLPGSSGASSGTTGLRWERIEAADCSARIGRTEESIRRPVPLTRQWMSLELAQGQPVAVIWEFGDARYAVGRMTRHQWIHSGKSTVTATAFDDRGRVCGAALEAEVALSRGSAGCECRSYRTNQKHLLWKLFDPKLFDPSNSR